MSSMLKLLSTTLLLSSLAYATTTSEKIEEFLNDEFSDNPRLSSVEVKVEDEVPLKDLKGWSGYIVNVKAKLKGKKEEIKQKMIWFSNGTMITKALTNMDTLENMTEVVKPSFKQQYYKKENLIYGNENAKHKVALFSDPLCPFCRGFIPGAIKDMKKNPEKFAIYYYHLPLERIHPASVTLVKAAAAAEQKGVKDVVLKLYNVKVNPREKDVKKILTAFNKAVGTNITEADIKSKKVLDHVNSDMDVARNLLVGGTPTVYLDGKLDNTKKKYKTVK